MMLNWNKSSLTLNLILQLPKSMICQVFYRKYLDTLTDVATNHHEAQTWKRHQSQRTLQNDPELKLSIARNSRTGIRYSGLSFCFLKTQTWMNLLNSSMWKVRKGRSWNLNFKIYLDTFQNIAHIVTVPYFSKRPF